MPLNIPVQPALEPPDGWVVDGDVLHLEGGANSAYEALYMWAGDRNICLYVHSHGHVCNLDGACREEAVRSVRVVADYGWADSDYDIRWGHWYTEEEPEDDEPDYDEAEYDEDDGTELGEQESSDRDVDQPVLSPENLGFEARYFNPDRGDQLTSVELEFGKDPSGIASTLYNRGLSTTSSVGGYHNTARANRGTAYVEYDGSVSGGGEMVISMVKLPDEQETLRLWHSVSVLRDSVHNGSNKLDMRCGCHIHVNALGRDLNSVISTVVAYNHIEDILYRMSAANYSRHRVDGGNEYCNTTPKSITDKERFRASFGHERYYGLNVGNYLQYRYDCSCGAGFDHADLCTCDPEWFYKPTLEFRLFNTTANGAKLHAFIAVCQALVHYGMNRNLMSSDLDPLTYGNTVGIAAYADRLTWMLTELPLSASERNSIRYCFRNCDIARKLEAGVREGKITAEQVQAILHEDELLEVSDYTVPERIEEAATTSTGRANWLPTQLYNRAGNRVYVDGSGRYRDDYTGRYTTPRETVGTHDPDFVHTFPDINLGYVYEPVLADGETIEF